VAGWNTSTSREGGRSIQRRWLPREFRYLAALVEQLRSCYPTLKYMSGYTGDTIKQNGINTREAFLQKTFCAQSPHRRTIQFRHDDVGDNQLTRLGVKSEER
jgi:hypothetical protein